MEVTIITFRDIFQSEAQEMDRFGDEYRNRSALILLDGMDMKRIGVEDEMAVLLESDAGKVVVLAKRSPEEESHSGIAFMPNSPWSNQLIPEEMGKSRIPEFKRIPVNISPTNEDVTDIYELLERLVG
jgi:formylmethanofuran dehydrogenase subunit D